MSQHQNKKLDSSVIVAIVGGVFSVIVAVVTGIFSLSPLKNNHPSSECSASVHERPYHYGIDPHYYQLDTFFFTLNCETIQDTTTYDTFRKNRYFTILVGLKNKIPHSIDPDYFIKDSKKIIIDAKGQPRVDVPGFNNLIGVFKDGIKKGSNGNMEYYVITRIPKRARDLYPERYENISKIIGEPWNDSEQDISAIYKIITSEAGIKSEIKVIAEEYKLYLLLIKDYLFLRLADIPVELPPEFPKAEYELTDEQELVLRLITLSWIEEQIKRPYNKGKKFTVLCKGSSTAERVQSPIPYNMSGCWNQNNTPVYLGDKYDCQRINNTIQTTKGDTDGNIQLSYARAYSGIAYIQNNLFSLGDERKEKLKNISFAYQGLGVKDKRTIVIELIEQ
ncbi:MAG TPA: hypothetical protein PKC76_19335 [Saprospiraceae bacterium]|nr:hypothetical protein [Saprospiraceae bacterium]